MIKLNIIIASEFKIGDFDLKSVRKIVLSALFDFFLAAFSVALFAVISGGVDSAFFEDKNAMLCGFIIYPAIITVVNYLFRNYNVLWGYAGILDYVKRALSTCISSFAYYVIIRSFHTSFKAPFSFQDTLDIFLITLILVFSVRLVVKLTTFYSKDSDCFEGNIMVIGAGAAARMIISDIKANKMSGRCNIKCVIDDDPAKLSQYICGVKIVGNTLDIVSLAKKYKIDSIVFAIPSCTSERKSQILKLCQKADCRVSVIPSVYQLVSDENINLSSLRKIQIEDLLGRDPININVEEVMNYVENKVVLVTGGGGSIGSELCRQIASHKPKQLIVFDIYENNAYDIQNELLRNYPDLDLEVRIGSVRDTDRLDSIFNQFRPQIVYHAAAHKHVPLMEDSPNESIKNNVFGTLNTVKCADKYAVNKFVLISTDKAVNPTNIMGASKRICEIIVQTYNNHSDTEFVAVRFGNVLGSNGSVIPLFKKQIEQGGPVTVTDPNIIRYFMTIPEAVSLVLQAGASAKGGEIFVLDMGEPVRILDLAENLIKLAGYKPYEDIKIEFTGLRPGEKLYEEKLLSEEGLTRTKNKLIHIGHPIEIDEEILFRTLEEMHKDMSDDNYDMRKLVKQIVPTYSYTEKKNTSLNYSLQKNAN